MAHGPVDILSVLLAMKALSLNIILYSSAYLFEFFATWGETKIVMTLRDANDDPHKS
jgi:hypothetical protein